MLKRLKGIARHKKARFSNHEARFELLYSARRHVHDKKGFQQMFCMPNMVFDCISFALSGCCLFMQRYNAASNKKYLHR